ncbi:hypothetical protein DPMN_089337 [Dreissena polymorpha]|uniref:Uncharacterized protein n=1 Tax=Dreissena polymorpha TaxID=45954 RepID=A0A9D4KVS9_DREPO|nr:hypothetical protein DPMN_089337 [Dreissena polymorpha]
MDSKFDAAPKQFAQLFIICVPFEEPNVSAVHGFLPSNSQVCYKEFFSALLDACLKKNI